MSLLIVENAFTTLRTLLITRSRILFKLNFALNFIFFFLRFFFPFGLNLVPVKLLLRTFRARLHQSFCSVLLLDCKTVVFGRREAP